MSRHKNCCWENYLSHPPYVDFTSSQDAWVLENKTWTKFIIDFEWIHRQMWFQPFLVRSLQICRHFVRLESPFLHGCHLHSTSTGPVCDGRRQYSVHTLQSQNAPPLHIVCTCVQSKVAQKENLKWKDDDMEQVIWKLCKKLSYQGRVRWERVFNSVREVKLFWKGDFAVEFSGARVAISNPFQVHTQNLREGEQFETLKKNFKSFWLLVHYFWEGR